MIRRFSWIVSLLVLVGGCTSVNQPLEPQHMPNRTRAALAADPPAPHDAAPMDSCIQPAATRTAIDPNNDGYFVGVAISGGGSRSANFSAACMFQLQRLGLLQRADYISSVSGGSITGAFYCITSDADWNEANIRTKLTHHFATDMIWTMAMPWNSIALMFSDWDRSDLLAGTLKKNLYSQGKRALTFADLRTDRPHLLINATDLQSGKPFIFCNEAFDQIGSDLSTYPLAYAVAASSAAPVLLHQVTLRDYSHPGHEKYYRHLVDGGVVDNLGVKSLVETYRAQLKSSKGSAYPRGAVFILLDARTQYDARISTRGDTSVLESLQFSAGLSSTMLLNRASSATLDEIILDSAPDAADAATLRRERDELINGGYVQLETSDGRPVYVLHLALSRVDELKGLPFKDRKEFADRVNSISTYLNIDQAEAEQLYRAAELLVKERFASSLKQIADELNGASIPATQP